MAGCNCTGMSFICNRWVFTGECKHTRAKEVAAHMALLRRAWNDTHGGTYAETEPSYGFTDTEEH